MFDFFVVLIAIFVFIYTDPYVDAGFLVVVGFLSLMLGTNHLFGIISEGSPGWHWILAIVNYSVAACCITIAVITLRRIYEFFRS